MEIDFNPFIIWLKKLLFDYNKPNNVYDIIIVKRFLWFPKILNYKFKWLKFANYYAIPEREFTAIQGPMCVWNSFEWID